MKFDHVNTSAASEAETYPQFYDEPLGVLELAQMQGVSPVNDTTTLLADFWPEHDSIEDFTAAVQRWRQEDDQD